MKNWWWCRSLYKNVFNIIDRSKDVPQNLEAICVEIIKPKAKPFLVTTVYRPPSSGSEFVESFETYLQTLDSDQGRIQRGATVAKATVRFS